MSGKHDHQRHQPDPKAAMAHAEEVCGSRLTDTRRAVLELLLSSAHPMSAYDLLDSLSASTGRGWKPPTVYRALDFLVAQGIASRLESRNAYTICAHIGVTHACVFFICRCCGEALEVMDGELERQLAAAARELGFVADHPVVEVEGICKACRPHYNPGQETGRLGHSHPSHTQAPRRA